METILYPLKAPSRRRNPDKQMHVLCLGLSRSGTDSLRNALLTLGYHDVYHGFVITSQQRSDCAFWVPLMRRKFGLNHQPMLAEKIDFDSVLATCEAVTDGPANVFGPELMAYYPRAKVILNRRKNTDAWHASMHNTCLQVFSWPMWVLSWFDTKICWLWWNFELVMQGYYHGDFDRFGKAVAVNHYAELETSCKNQGREYLNWSVEDGWSPLCEFLNKPVPDIPFPSGNQTGGQFEQNMEEATKDLVLNALRNIAIFMAVITGTGGCLWWILGNSYRD